MPWALLASGSAGAAGAGGAANTLGAMFSGLGGGNVPHAAPVQDAFGTSFSGPGAQQVADSTSPPSAAPAPRPPMPTLSLPEPPPPAQAAPQSRRAPMAINSVFGKSLRRVL